MLKKIVFGKTLNTLKSIHGKHITRSFATGCEKIRVARSELEEAFSNNFNEIKDLAKNKGTLVSAYYLERLADLQKGDKEMFETLYQNLMTSNLTGADENALINALKGITNKHVLKHLPVSQAEALLQAIHKRILEIQHLFTVSQKKEINSTLKSWNDALLGEEDYSLLQLKTPTTDEVLKSLDPNGKLENLRSKLVIHEYDVEKSKVVVEFPSIGRIITMMGIDMNPTNSMDNVLGALMNDQKKFNTLVLEDAPRDSSPSLGPIDPSNFINNMVQLSKYATQKAWLEGADLQEYIDRMTKDPQFFKYNPKNDMITNPNPIVGIEIPNVLSTAIYRFNKKAITQNLTPTIQLADITLREIQAYYIKEKSLTEIQELHAIMCYISLLEKLSTAYDMSAKGCAICSGRRDFWMPRDGQFILAGGDELPLEKRYELLANSLIDAAWRTGGNSETEIFALFGSYNLLRIIQKLIQIIENMDKFEGWNFNRKHFVTKLYEIDGLNDIQRKSELLEKWAIIDNIVAAGDPTSVENLLGDAMRDDIQKYLELGVQYEEKSSLEYHCRHNTGTYKYSADNCMGESLIFGAERIHKPAEKPSEEHKVPTPEVPKKKASEVKEKVSEDNSEPEEVLVLKSDAEIKSKRKKK